MIYERIDHLSSVLCQVSYAAPMSESTARTAATLAKKLLFNPPSCRPTAPGTGLLNPTVVPLFSDGAY